jgi:hypothetical protein
MTNFMTFKVSIILPKPLILLAYYQQRNVDYTKLDVVATMA